MKKVIIRIGAAAAILLVVGAMVMYTNIRRFNKEVSNLEIHDIDLSKVEDGEYVGQYDFGKLVYAKVKVIVEGNKISSIDFIEHNYGLGQKAEAIVESVIENQSLEVDVISGATGSSKVILKAIEDALEIKR